MNTRFLTSGEKKKLLAQLESFGMKKAPYLFIESGKERIRAFSGTLSRDELVALGGFARVEVVGTYFARKEPFGLRFGFDMLHLIQDSITERVIDLTAEEFEHWMRGQVLTTTMPSGIYVMRYQGDLVGCTYSTGSKLLNFVPKERQKKH